MPISGLSAIKPIQTRPIKQDPHKMTPSSVSCFDKASTEVLFELEYAIIAQKYCDKCLSNAEM